jgi:tetratricopeptide (TPR) repeat protein/TolB-like protein
VIGQTLSHYRVLEEIGAGGMGVVYRAHDEHLDRDVALKVLPPGTLADEAARSRFRKEALFLARLDHPNIATIFEFGSQDGIDFLAAAYIPGLTLDTKLAARPLPPPEVISLGIQLAKGLAAAHEQGVIHRDLKPGNLRLTPDGLLKILDFGLARLDERKGDGDASTTSITQSSQQITGTLPYMAPEQLRGEAADARSDIWAAGAVLYEMATGRRPFPGSGPKLIDAILNVEPKPPHELNRDVPAGLENIILKALDKAPSRRYQTAADLRVDLERLQSGLSPAAKRPQAWRPKLVAGALALVLVAALAGYFVWRRTVVSGRAAPRRSVAVLGFQNLGGRPDKAWISTALSEMLTTELGVGGRLRTIPGESVARMEADLAIPNSETLANDTLAKVSKALGSNLIVLGSYLDLGGQIRVDLRVQDTTQGETIATASEVGSEGQFFDLVKRLGESLREKCGGGRVSPEELGAAMAAQPANTDAARFYSEGLVKLRQFDALAARDLLQKAVEADPNHALAHAALAAAWSQLGYDANALAESKRAFELSSHLLRQEKLSIEGQYREDSRDWNKAVEIYQSLWVFFPDDVEFGLRLADAQISAGNGKDALQTIKALRALPAPSRDDPRIDLTEAKAEGSLGNFQREKAGNQQAIDKAQKLGARLLAAQAVLQQCWALRNTGDLPKAKAAGQQAQQVFASEGDLRQEARSLTCIGIVLSDQGDLAAAQTMHQQALDLARKIGAQKDIAGALINLGNVSAARQRLSESTKQYQQALSVAVAIGDQPDAQLARNNIGANLMLECDFPGARKMVEDSFHTSQAIGDQSGMVTALINLGVISYNQGRLDDARQSLSDALTKSRTLGLKSSAAQALSALGDLQLAQDDLAGAEKSYQESLAIETQTGEQGGIAMARLGLAGVALERDGPTQALTLAQQAATEFEAEKNGDEQAAARNLTARALIAQNHPDQAQAELTRVRGLTISDKSIALSLDLTAARLLIAQRKTREALKKLSTILAETRRLQLPGYEFQARLAQGEALALSGDATTARSGLRKLKEDAARAGFKLLARKAANAEQSVDSRSSTKRKG